jgi:uncharacterized glyoxalase superfamily protein PhnB
MFNGNYRGNNFSLSLEFSKETEKATYLFKALAERGKFFMPLEDTFRGGSLIYSG